MSSGAAYRRFQRNFLPGTIGLQPEDERAYYKNLQQQSDVSGDGVSIGTIAYDIEARTITCTSHVDNTVTVEHADGRKIVTDLVPPSP